MDNPDPPNSTQLEHYTQQSPRTPTNRGASSRGRGRPRGSRARGVNRSTGICAATDQPLEDHEENPVSTTRTTSQQGPKKLRWTGAMEIMMLDLYAEEVEKGKQMDNGFQNTSHRNVAQKLREAFPETEHLLDYTKCKAKLNQSFKRDYDVFVACKEASGFGWDETLCEVTASDEVWERYVAIHPNARKFWEVPYPEFCSLDKIFGSSLATGEGSRSLSQRLQVQSPPTNPNLSGNLPEQPNEPMNSPTNYVSRSHTKRDSIANAIHGLVGYINTRREEQSQHHQQRQSSTTTHLQRAMALYQEEHAQQASQTEQLQAFEIFRDNTVYWSKMRSLQTNTMYRSE
ncbi:hypothetical protein PTTG_10408, partial [Puccinia triticina 1-1 BBBD Race 1]